MTDHPGIAAPEVTEWLADTVPEAAPPFDFDLIAAGGSNLTYLVTDAAHNRWALRRPPVGRALATAHDMGREWRILEALETVEEVPVPGAVAFCGDAAITGAPFYVMSFVDGRILRDREDGDQLSAQAAAAATRDLVRVQVSLHTLDFEAVGLGELGRHTGYVSRQLKRWHDQVQAGGVRSLPLHTELHSRLVDAAPPDSREPALVHGDYRFDNCVLAADWTIAAVLDWELATIGDPLADFAWSLRYWSDPGDELAFLTSAPTLAPAFGRRADYLDLYEEASGFDLSDLHYFEIFSWWKQASIVEGVYARRLAGSSGGMAQRGEPALLAVRVDAMLAHAGRLAEGVI